MALIAATFQRSGAKNVEQETRVECVYRLQNLDAVGTLRERGFDEFNRAGVVAENNQWLDGTNQSGLIVRPACDGVLRLIDDWKSPRDTECCFLNLARRSDCLDEGSHSSPRKVCGLDCSLPIPLAAEVVVAIRRDFFFWDDLGGGREGEDGLGGRFGAQCLEVGGQFSLHLREIVLLDGAALGTKAEAIVLHFEEGNGVALSGDRFVEDEDTCLHPGVGIETTRRKRDDGDEGVFDEHFPQFFIGGLALKNDAFGDDDAGAASGREVLGHVVHEEDLAALGLN